VTTGSASAGPQSGAKHEPSWNCWDNAVAESFFSSLKKERIRKRIYKTRDLARADIFDYIEVFYNRARRHSHLGGVSPEAFEQASS
jgi:putative transposase